MHVQTKSHDERLRAIFHELLAHDAPEFPYIFFELPENDFELKHNSILDFLGGVRPEEVKEANHWLAVWENRIAKGIY